MDKNLVTYLDDPSYVSLVPFVSEQPRSCRMFLMDYFAILLGDLADYHRMRKALVVPV